MINSPPKAKSPSPADAQAAGQGNASQNEASYIRPPPGERPPSYGTQPTQPLYPNVQPYPVVEVIIYRQPPMVRFCRAFFVALLIWLLASAFIQSLISLAHWTHRHGRWDTEWKDYNVPAELDIGRCVDWWKDRPLTYGKQNESTLWPGSFPYTSKSTFELPLSSETLFLISRGPLSAGSAHVVSSNELDGDSVRVDVSVRYFRESIRDRVKVCNIARKEGEHGVGIFSPTWSWLGRQEDRAHVEIVVTIPEALAHDHKVIKAFETDLPNTFQQLDDFAKKVKFNRLSLRSSNSPIFVKSVSLVEGNFKTTNGPIEGVFNATKSLVLHTSDSKIEADVGLRNDNENASVLDMRTSNGFVLSKISLLTSSNHGGNFEVKAKSSNSMMRLSFPASPVDSQLQLDAKTSNGPLFVSLNPAYEGKFSLSTSNGGTTVNEHSNVEDPSGKSRKRNVSRNSVRRKVLGEVSWSDSGKNRGNVIMSTSNSPVTLDL